MYFTVIGEEAGFGTKWKGKHFYIVDLSCSLQCYLASKQGIFIFVSVLFWV
jgi:hypothetical protein